jgi:hypothetical protein
MPASPSGAQSPKRDRRIVRKVIHVMRVIVVPLLITWQFPDRFDHRHAGLMTACAFAFFRCDCADETGLAAEAVRPLRSGVDEARSA